MTLPKVLTAALMAATILRPTDSHANDPFAGLDSIGHADLGHLRGGMLVNGIPVNFAVTIRTTVEGALAASGLQTMLTIDDMGGLAGMTTSALGADLATFTGDGVMMTLSGGDTAILHRVIDGQIQALIANTLDAVTISHQTELNVTMPGFEQMARTYSSHSHVSSLGRESVMAGLGRF